MGFRGLAAQVGPEPVQFCGGPTSRRQTAAQGTAGQVPKEDGGVTAPRSEGPSVRGKSQGPDQTLIRVDPANLQSRIQFPEMKRGDVACLAARQGPAFRLIACQDAAARRKSK